MHKSGSRGETEGKGLKPRVMTLLYILLALVGLAGAAYVLLRAEYRATGLIFLAVAAAIVMFADWIAFGWFGAYEYHPGLLADTLTDGALGEFLADILFVPSFSLVLVRFLPGGAGILLGTAVVTLVEINFCMLNIYHRHGWPIWGTPLGFLFYFAGLDLFWRDLRERVTTGRRLRLLLRSALLFDVIALLSLWLRAARTVETNIYLMPTYYGNQSLGRFLTYPVVVMPLGMWALEAEGTGRRTRVAVAMVVVTGLDLTLTVLDFQHAVPPWHFLLDALAQGAAVVVTGLLEAWLISQYQLQPLRQS